MGIETSFSITSGPLELIDRGDSYGTGTWIHQYVLSHFSEDNGYNTRAINIHNDKIVVAFGDVDYGPREFVTALKAALSDIGEVGIDFAPEDAIRIIQWAIDRTN